MRSCFVTTNLTWLVLVFFLCGCEVVVVLGGTANTGGGGGGGGSAGGYVGSAGGSGVVIISVPTDRYTGITTGSPTVTTSGANTIMQFNSSGSYTA